MFKIIGSLMAVTGLLLGASQVAEAQGTTYRNHDSPGYYQGVIYRKQHMPRWLWHKKSFRRWYFRTPLRFNRRIAWQELHAAYSWERRYGTRGHYRARHNYNGRNYDRHWKDDDRKRRNKQRRRNRDD
jgi:hypothetical protein